MSQDINKVELSGVLGWEPRLDYTQRGTAKVTTKLVVSDGEYKGKPRQMWIPLTVWGDLAEEFANAGWAKGDQIKVTGKYNVNRWKPQGSAEWREEHGVVVLAWEGTPSGAQSMGEEIQSEADEDVPF